LNCTKSEKDKVKKEAGERFKNSKATAFVSRDKQYKGKHVFIKV